MGFFSKKEIPLFDHLPHGSYRVVMLFGLDFDWPQIDPLLPSLLAPYIPEADLYMHDNLYVHESEGWKCYDGFGTWTDIIPERTFANNIRQEIFSLPEPITEQAEIDRLMALGDKLAQEAG